MDPRLTLKSSATRRIALVDVLRGGALAAMAVYHFAVGSQLLRARRSRRDRKSALDRLCARDRGSFLALVGVGLYLSHRKGVRWTPFLRRLVMIAAAALPISIASWFADPDGVILFGILHCIAVSSVIGLAFLRAPLRS